MSASDHVPPPRKLSLLEELKKVGAPIKSNRYAVAFVFPPDLSQPDPVDSGAINAVLLKIELVKIDDPRACGMYLGLTLLDTEDCTAIRLVHDLYGATLRNQRVSLHVHTMTSKDTLVRTETIRDITIEVVDGMLQKDAAADENEIRHLYLLLHSPHRIPELFIPSKVTD